MPKSKKARVVPLTKVTKKGKAQKEKLVTELRDACDTYPSLFIFSINNMRNVSFKKVREEWKSSRFFLGKNKVMALALGRSKESEYKPNLVEVAKRVTGSRGLLFTEVPKDKVVEYFSKDIDEHFARSGFTASTDFVLEPGPLTLPFSIEPQLRKLGLPTRLRNGIIHLETKTSVCKKGDVLSPEQCKILEYFGQKTAVMRVVLHAFYSFKDNKFELLSSEEEGDVDAGGDDEKEGTETKSSSLADGDEELVDGSSIPFSFNLEPIELKLEDIEQQLEPQKSKSKKGGKKGTGKGGKKGTGKGKGKGTGKGSKGKKNNDKDKDKDKVEKGSEVMDTD